MTWIIVGLVLMLISLIVMTAIGISGIFLWRSNGPLMNSCAKMLLSTSVEIFIAIAAEIYLAIELGGLYTKVLLIYSIIKAPGRLIELWGVIQFLNNLKKYSPSSVQIPKSDY